MQTFSQIYDTHAKAVLTAYDLENAGIPSSDIDISHVKAATAGASANRVGPARVVYAGIGAALGAIVGVLTQLDVATRSSPAASEESSWLAMMLLGAAAGAVAGAVAAYFFNSSTGEVVASHKADLQSDLGTQVTVRTEKVASQVTEILRRHLSTEPLMPRRT